MSQSQKCTHQTACELPNVRLIRHPLIEHKLSWIARREEAQSKSQKTDAEQDGKHGQYAPHNKRFHSLTSSPLLIT